MSLTYLEAWRLRRRIDAEGGSLRPWLMGIATNVIRNQRRAARRHAQALARMPRPEDVPDFAEEVVQRMADAGRARAVDFIPDGKRCIPSPRSTSWVPGVRLASPQSDAEDGGGPCFRIDPSAVGPGQTAVLEFMVRGGSEAGISDRVSDGPVAECRLIDR